MATLGGFNADGGDPRLHHPADGPNTYVSPQHRLLHDPSVTFEEYHYYALRTRAEEDAAAAQDTPKTGIMKVCDPSSEDQVIVN